MLQLSFCSFLMMFNLVKLCGTMQAHAPPPGYFVRLENTSADDDLYLRKKVRMRRWLCCSCHVEESYPSHENEHLKSPSNYADGNIFLLSFLILKYGFNWNFFSKKADVGVPKVFTYFKIMVTVLNFIIYLLWAIII